MQFIGYWVSKGGPKKFNFFLDEIKTLSSLTQVEFNNILRSANAMANALAKQRVDCVSSFVILKL